ncbi:ABC transporter permease [Vibrio galatheae]|uniref:ABC transporter permease n=1 Tax=Vibrio galatheae TaxID=579748 RepID=A0A0F4NNE1_9VIBR|nr:FtsX-like permease family protein [Vibrio galatheae]KJY84670.1 ABC transporter permease [Vibrio galatheae]
MLIKLAWRNLWRNKLRTSVIIGAMVFGLVGVVTMMGFMTGFVDSMINNAIRWQTSHLQIHNSQYIVNPDISEQITHGEELVTKLSKIKNISAISARFIADGMVASARSNRGVRIVGVNAEKEALITPLKQHITSGDWLDLPGRNPILVSEKIAERLKLKVGSKVVLTFTDNNGQVVGAAYRVRGIFKTPSSTFDDSNVFVRRADLQATAGMEGIHEIALVLHNLDTLKSTQQTIQAVVTNMEQSPQAATVRNWQQIQPMLSTMMDTMDVSNRVIIIIFVVAMMFGIINIMLMSVFERTQEFGVLMAVGMQKHKIFALIMLETLYLGITGAILGIVVSAILTTVLGQVGISLASMSDGLGAYGIDTLLYPRVTVVEYQMIFVTVLMASVIAAIYPARQILKQRPVDAMAEKN